MGKYDKYKLVSKYGDKLGTYPKRKYAMEVKKHYSKGFQKSIKIVKLKKPIKSKISYSTRKSIFPNWWER